MSESLYYDICFIAADWNQTRNISEVCLKFVMKSEASEYIESETHFHFSIALLLYGVNFFVKNSKMHKVFTKSMNGIAGRSVVSRESKSKPQISIYVGSPIEINGGGC